MQTMFVLPQDLGVVLQEVDLTSFDIAFQQCDPFPTSKKLIEVNVVDPKHCIDIFYANLKRIMSFGCANEIGSVPLAHEPMNDLPLHAERPVKIAVGLHSLRNFEQSPRPTRSKRRISFPLNPKVQEPQGKESNVTTQIQYLHLVASRNLVQESLEGGVIDFQLENFVKNQPVVKRLQLANDARGKGSCSSNLPEPIPSACPGQNRLQPANPDDPLHKNFHTLATKKI